MKIGIMMSLLFLSDATVMAHQSSSTGVSHLLEHGPLLNGASLTLSLTALLLIVSCVVGVRCLKMSTKNN